jgi:hypothetical protein
MPHTQKSGQAPCVQEQKGAVKEHKGAVKEHKGAMKVQKGAANEQERAAKSSFARVMRAKIEGSEFGGASRNPLMIATA